MTAKKKKEEGGEVTDDGAPKVRRVRKPRATAGEKKRAKEKRVELSKETLTELEALRRTLEEIVERYQLRVSGQLAELISILEAGLTAGDATAPSSAILQNMLERIHKTELKARKGRVKDLVRVHDLARELTEMLLLNPLD